MNESDHQARRMQFALSGEWHLKLLHQLHESLPASAPEREAVKIAAKALLYCLPLDDFRAFVENDELDADQKAHLRSLGIEP